MRRWNEQGSPPKTGQQLPISSNNLSASATEPLFPDQLSGVINSRLSHPFQSKKQPELAVIQTLMIKILHL
ncbi:MAG TPA: hypothetical protein VGL24_00545, partial [Chthoniobacterales bacterium]